MVFHWRLSDRKSPQAFMTLLSILAVLNNALVWMVSTRPSISKVFSPYSSLLVTVPSSSITSGITVTFMFDSCFFFFISQARSWYLSLFLLSLIFTLWSAGTASPLFQRFSFLLMIIIIIIIWKIIPTSLNWSFFN